MGWVSAMLAALGSTLERPSWWVLALASFLVRGGLLVFVLPIVILPTPAGLLTHFGTELTGLAFGAPSVALITSIVVAAVGVIAWLIVGGLVAVWIDLALIAAVAGERRIARRVDAVRWLAWRALAIRLVSHLPLLIALSWGVARIYDATFAEYRQPGDPTIPLVIRIVSRAPDVIAVIGLVWAAGETAAGLAVRHVALRRVGVLRALVRGWIQLLRPATVATFGATAVALLGVTIPTGIVASLAWERLRVILAEASDPGIILLALLGFAATWVGGLVLTAAIAGWRSSAWTFEVARRELPADDLEPVPVDRHEPLPERV